MNLTNFFALPTTSSKEPQKIAQKVKEALPTEEAIKNMTYQTIVWKINNMKERAKELAEQKKQNYNVQDEINRVQNVYLLLLAEKRHKQQIGAVASRKVKIK